MTDRRQITYKAPIVAIDYAPNDLPIWPCHDCYPWHLEVITDSAEAPVIVREWHAIGCPMVSEPQKDGLE